MQHTKALRILQIAAMAVLILPGLAFAGVPYPHAATPKPVDLGPLSAQLGSTPISVTLALSLPNLADAENLLQAIHTPGDPQFHKFLTAQQFVARFGPSDADVAKVVARLSAYGLTVERTTATTLKVTGLPANLERAFAVSLHSYSVAAHGNAPGYTFHAPLSRPTIPTEVSAAVAAVVGLDNRPSLRPRLKAAPLAARSSAPPATKGNPFGSLTVVDFAKHYDVQPLYNHGVSGNGRTLGIVTFASFTPSDAYAYWKAVGLTVDPKRIKIVEIDGGSGAPSDASGSLETTVDVEQSGGIAPGAKVIVYEAANSNQGQVDVFAAAIDANDAESLSTSWGFWEWFQNLENSPVTDAITGRTVGLSQATHELLVRAAIQGQTVFAAAGDSGAYDVNGDLGCDGPYSSAQPNSTCSLALTVDYPASDPAITAAGGTTLPGTQENCLNAACTAPFYPVVVPHERVWGWDYLLPYYETAFGCDSSIDCGIFPVGGGGGVSTVFQTPFYQYGLPGVQRSHPKQIFEAGEDFIAEVGIVDLYYPLPSYYPGRNVPDVSFNADPYTGYVVYYTSNVTGFSPQSGWGGTSFVGPQLNGVTALLGEYVHGRIGLLNYPLYGLATSGQAYGGSKPPLHAIAYGDNWFYKGSNGFNPGAGLGTIDVSDFAEALRDMF